MSIRKVLTTLLIVFMVATTGAAAWAQAGTGELTGQVTDPTAAVVAGIRIELTNDQTGLVYTTETSTAGLYRFVALPVGGTYTLTAKPAGFKAVRVAGIVVSVGTVFTRDLRLEIGTAAETVTVEAGAELVQTGDASVSGLVDQRIWQSMPLEVRNQNSFIELVPGVVPDNQAGSTRGAAVNGARGGAGNYLVEGQDNNDQGQGGRGQLSSYDAGGAVTSISPDAIQEYRVITNSFAAEYGKAGGFVTDTVLKSGTNQWHGSVFEYNRVQALAAQHFFAGPQHDAALDSLVRNQFGGSIGGPIRKDKTFFFSSVEFHRARDSAPLSAVGTTQQFLDFVRSGALQQWAESDPSGYCMVRLEAACPGAFSGAATLGPVFTRLKDKGPYFLATSNFSNQGQGLFAAYTYPVPVYGDVQVTDPYHLNEIRGTLKVDHKFSERDQLSAMYLIQDANSGSKYDGGDNAIGPAYTNIGRSQNVGLSWNHTFTPTILNNFKISYLRHVSNFPSPSGYEDIPSIYTALDNYSVGLGMSNSFPQFFTDNQFQYQDHLSFVKGKHSFKTGVEYRRIRNGSSFMADKNGTYLPYGIEDFVTDAHYTEGVDVARFGAPHYGGMYYASAAVDMTNGQSPMFYRGYRANEFGAYFQDDWRLNNRVTVNLGLRWEYFGPPHNFKPNIDTNVYFGLPVAPFATTSTNPFMPVNDPFYASVSTANFQVRNHEIWNKDTNNFGPRVGIAWDVFGTQKFVVRAGAGIMYDRIWNNAFENIRFNPPYYSDNRIGRYGNGVPIGSALYNVPVVLSAYSDPANAPIPNPRHMDQNLVMPYYEQYHLGFEWEFLKGYMLQSEYIGTMGHKLLGLVDINTYNGRMVGDDNSYINPNFGADNFRTNVFASNYNSLQTTVRRTYANGISFNASYTYSKAMDYLSDLFNNRATSGVTTDNMNPRYDYAAADFDIRHRVVGTLSYDLPFFKENRWLGGWGINSIVTLQGGVPFTPYDGGLDLNADGYFTDRVVYNGSGGPMNSVRGRSPALGYLDANQWSDFTCPVTANEGTWCNAPINRNSVSGPGFKNIDFNITKKFALTERVKLNLQGNFFNLFNHPNFKLPNAAFDSSQFGRSTATYDPRVTQLALRLDF